MDTQAEEVQGVVEEALPNTLFRVSLPSGDIILAYLAGKMRLHRIKVLVGDKVVVKLDPYGGKGRIYTITMKVKASVKARCQLQNNSAQRTSVCYLQQSAP